MGSKKTRTYASCWLWWRDGREVMVWKKRSSYGWGFVWGGRRVTRGLGVHGGDQGA